MTPIHPISSSCTDDHPSPVLDPTRQGREVLIVAFPRAMALQVPAARDAVGRAWLAASGVIDTQVSGAHVRFSRAGGTLYIEDAGSRNGTWLDGVRLYPGDRVALSDGALLRLGNTLLYYREALLGDPAPAPPIGELVGPYGLRGVSMAVEALAARVLPNVLIEGESGTGKELLAAAIATRLGRNRPYCAVNMAAVPAGVFESHLFGHTANAFSGATRASRGVLAAHQGGAVFLDELGELPIELQPKLLRLLENREIHPVGAERPVVVDVLLIAATNRALEEQVQRGAFRGDLFARWASGRLEIPPLRERAEDIWTMCETLAARRGTRLDPTQVEIEAVEQLSMLPYAYNVRDLAATLERIFSMSPPPSLRRWAVERVVGPSTSSRRPGHLTAERIAETMAACGNNETETARRLGVSRGKLRRFLSRPR